jgi:hypothetical protein
MLELLIAAVVAFFAVGFGILVYEIRLHRKAIEEALDADAEAAIARASDGVKKAL